MKFKTSKKLARYLHCSESSIVKWRNSGLPHKSEGLHYVYDLEEVLTWLATRSKRHCNLVENLRTRLREETQNGSKEEAGA